MGLQRDTEQSILTVPTYLLGYPMYLKKVPNDILARNVARKGNRNRLRHHQVTSIRLLPLVQRITSMVRRLARM